MLEAELIEQLQAAIQLEAAVNIIYQVPGQSPAQRHITLMLIKSGEFLYNQAMEQKLVVANLDELASRWQIPVERVIYLITDCGMEMRRPEKWVAQHWELLIAEKQKAFDDSLFPRKFRPESAETSA